MTEQDDAQTFYDELARGIGDFILRLPAICERMGWENPGGARAYLHPTSMSAGIAVDFIDWTLRRANDEALDRLYTVSRTWWPDDALTAIVASHLTASSS